MSLCLFSLDGRLFGSARQLSAMRASAGHIANFDRWSYGDRRRSEAVQLFQAMVEVARGFCGVITGMAVFHVEHWRREADRRAVRLNADRGGSWWAPRSPDSGRLRGKPTLQPGSAAGRRGRAV
jgi:hypothetical protein